MGTIQLPERRNNRQMKSDRHRGQKEKRYIPTSKKRKKNRTHNAGNIQRCLGTLRMVRKERLNEHTNKGERERKPEKMY